MALRSNKKFTAEFIVVYANITVFLWSIKNNRNKQIRGTQILRNFREKCKIKYPTKNTLEIN